MTQSRPPTDVDERALIEAAKRDRHAFAPLYDRYATTIYRYCYRQTGDAEEANDLTAMTFMKALERLSRFESYEGSSFKSWLFAIAHNVIVDRWRRKRPDSLADTACERLVDSDPGPEQIAVHRDEMARVLAVLDQLVTSQRDIVNLRLAGLSTQEIADTLQLTIGAVKSAQTRAYRRIRELTQPAEGTS